MTRRRACRRTETVNVLPPERRLTRDEALDALDWMFSARTTIAEYRGLSPRKGLAKATAYLEGAKRGQQNAGSDFFYWMMEADIALAEALVGTFAHLAAGGEVFPPLPDVSGKCIADATYAVADWGKALAAEAAVAKDAKELGP